MLPKKNDSSPAGASSLYASSMQSWWDYCVNAFRRKWGIRIDHLLVTPSIQVVKGGIHHEERAKERPSDHAPAWIGVAD